MRSKLATTFIIAAIVTVTAFILYKPLTRYALEPVIGRPGVAFQGSIDAGFGSSLAFGACVFGGLIGADALRLTRPNTMIAKLLVLATTTLGVLIEVCWLRQQSAALARDFNMPLLLVPDVGLGFRSLPVACVALATMAAGTFLRKSAAQFNR